MISVEKFGHICGGALHVEYVGSGKDWMFLPFRDENLKEFHVLGDDRILAYASQQLALFDVRKKECVARRQVGVNLRLHASTNGEWIALVGKMDGENESLTVFDGHDLREIFRMDEEGLNQIRPVYERDDGALLVGGMTTGPVHTIFVVTFENDVSRVEKREGTALPGSYKANWPCPTRKRVLVLPGDRIPVMEESGEKSFGVSLDVWNLTTLEIERTAVVDKLPVSHQAIQKLALAGWDGSLRPDPSLDAAARSEILGFGRRWKTLIERHLLAVAWEPNGEAFWAAFAGGYVRRATVAGSLSPRVIVERLWLPGQTRDDPDIREMAVLPDGRIRVEFYGIAAERKRQFVCFEPPAAAISGSADAPDINIPEAEDGLGEVPIGIPTGDEALKAHKKEFEERVQEAPVPLADFSAAACIDAIERLTGAISRDPYELVCGSSFRPTFVLPANGSPERRMGEDVFFAHVSAKVPEAGPAIERLLHMWMDKVPLSAKYRNYYMNNETVALSHALKALITLDPTCYGTIRRYITETDFEHDVIVKREILPYFGKLNGWRDMDAIKLGIFVMIEEWCAGSGGGWLDPMMQQKVEQTMTGREFAEFLIREVERYFSPDEASFNREAWNHNSVRSYLQECEMMNFRRPEGFDREVMAVIGEYLKRKPE